MIGIGGGAYITERKEIASDKATITLSTAAAAESDFYYLTPNAGERYDILFVEVTIPAPAGAGNGTHMLELALGDSLNGNYLSVFKAVSVFGSAITIAQNCYILADSSKLPPTDQGLQSNLNRVFANNTHQLYFNYTNNTNATQNGDAVSTIFYQVSKF